MDPIEGAIESFEMLSSLYDSHILSTSPWENPSAWSDKLFWVKKYFGNLAYKRPILSLHKSLNSGDYLIDDRTKNGMDRFSGKQLHFGSEAFPNWGVVITFLTI